MSDKEDEVTHGCKAAAARRHTLVAAGGYLVLYAAMVMAVRLSHHRTAATLPCLAVSPVIFVAVLFGIYCAVSCNCNLMAWIVAYFVLVMGSLMLLAAFGSARGHS